MLSQDRNKVTWSPRWRGPAYVCFLHVCTVSLQALKFLGSIKTPQKHYQLFTSRTVLATTAPRGNRLVYFPAVPGFRDTWSRYLSALTTRETAAPKCSANRGRLRRKPDTHAAAPNAWQGAESALTPRAARSSEPSTALVHPPAGRPDW